MKKFSKPAGWLVATALTIGATAIALAVAAPAHADVAAKGGDFVAVSPRQVMLDTRTGLGTPKAKLGAAQTISVQATGVAGIPATGVSGVVLAVTAIASTATTYLDVWPAGVTRPTNASFNVTAGVTMSSTVMAQVGAGGKVSFFNYSGTVDVTAAVEGYFTTGSAGSGPGGFLPITEAKMVSTGSGAGGVPVGKLAAGKSITAQLTGAAVPAGAYAVYGTLETTGATAAGTMTVDAAGVVDSVGVMAYGTGNTASSVMARLSASGQVTFKNSTASAVNLYYNVQGYIAADSAHGYGYRYSPPALLLSSVALAAGADLDVQLAGRGGIPTRGAGAAIVTVAATSQTAAGYLRVWPVDGTAPVDGAPLNWNGTDSRAAETVVPLAASGVVRVHNYSSGSIHVYLITRGWFDTGEAHDVAIEQHAATSVLQAVSGGSVDASYVNAGGSLFHGVAGVDSLDQAQWSVVPSNLEAFTGQPSIVRLPSGNLLVSVLHANDGEVWNFQVPASQSGWAPVYTHTAGVMAAPPVSGNLPDGTVLTFAVDSDGALWVLPTTGSVYWQRLGAANLVGTPTVVTTSTGVQLVGRTTSGTVTTASYVNGVLSAWTDLAGVGVSDKTAVVVNNGPRVRVVARQSDGSIVSKLQNLNGSWPASWTQAGSPGVTPAFIGAPAVGIDLGSGTDPGTGKAFLLARSAADGYLYQVDEAGVATGVWGEWYLVAGQSAAAGTDATVTPLGGSGNNFHWIASYLDVNGSPKIIHAAVV